MTCRPYQRECLDAIEKAFAEFMRVLLSLPTGGGKTCIFAWETKRRIEKGERVLILCHRDKLVNQAMEKLTAATGLKADKEKAESYASLNSNVVVASVQSLCKEKRLQRFPKGYFGLVICDECHRSLSPMWQRVLKHFDEAAQVLGVTATPSRSDHRNLGEYYQTVGFEVPLYSTKHKEGLINQGFLCPIVIKSIPLKIDVSKVSTGYDDDSGCTDFNKKELAQILEPYLDEIALAIKAHAGERRILAFCPLIDTSERFVAACVKAGIRAKHVDGEMPDRENVVKRFEAGDFDLLSNAMLLTEGYDVDSEPTGIGIDGIVILRLTKSSGLYCQAVGRGTRLAMLKENLLLLDFLWQHGSHDICRPAHLIAKDALEVEQITAMTQGNGLPADLAADMPLDLQTLATSATAKREEALRKRLEANRNKKAMLLSADDFCLLNKSLDLADYEPVMPWENAPLRDYERKNLKRAKIDADTVRGRGHAAKLLSVYWKNKPLEMAPKNQAAFMRRLGYRGDNPTAQQARAFFKERNDRKKEMQMI